MEILTDLLSLRRANKVALGAGGVNQLEGAIRAHENFVEYVPLGLILPRRHHGLEHGFGWQAHHCGHRGCATAHQFPIRRSRLFIIGDWHVCRTALTVDGTVKSTARL